MPLNKSPDYKIGTKAGRSKSLDVYQQRLLETDTSRKDYTYDTLKDYSEIHNSTPLWHGSGRYQYDDTGSVVDVFNSVLGQGGFTPKPDPYDLSSDMTSISLTPDRTYARMYADIHHTEPYNTPRHGSPDLLTGYYLGPVPGEALRETFKTFGLRESLRAIQRVRASGKRKRSMVKESKQECPSMTHIFREGSDIDGNYPILFGVTEVEEIPVSRYIAKHEVRTITSIDLSKVTHLEVPEANILETENLLAQHSVDIPIVPIELGEAYSSLMQQNRTNTQAIKP